MKKREELPFSDPVISEVVMAALQSQGLLPDDVRGNWLEQHFYLDELGRFVPYNAAAHTGELLAAVDLLNLAEPE